MIGSYANLKNLEICTNNKYSTSTNNKKKIDFQKGLFPGKSISPKGQFFCLFFFAINPLLKVNHLTK